MERIIVAGTRYFNDYELLKKTMDMIIRGERAIIVSGTAKGADKLGEEYALENNLMVHRFFPDWDTYGKSAGYRRNAEMANNATMAVIFWDGESKGSKHMIDNARRQNLDTYVVKYVTREVEHYDRS
jgi:hypothetical protein